MYTKWMDGDSDIRSYQMGGGIIKKGDFNAGRNDGVQHLCEFMVKLYYTAVVVRALLKYPLIGRQ